MEVAALPPIVVNWAGSETVSAEEYCAYMGELVGIEPVFEYTPAAHTALWPDVTYMHEILGRTGALAGRISAHDRGAASGAIALSRQRCCGPGAVLSEGGAATTRPRWQPGPSRRRCR